MVCEHECVSLFVSLFIYLFKWLKRRLSCATSPQQREVSLCLNPFSICPEEGAEDVTRWKDGAIH